MIEELIERMFKLRDKAHIAHWTTGNGEEHRALGELYEGLVDKLDPLVEAKQGMFGLIKAKAEKDMVAAIEDEVLWITEHRAEICNKIPALENMLDELTAAQLATLYKLKHLK